MTTIAPAEPKKRQSKLRRFGPPVIGLVVVVVIFAFVLPKIADYGSVWDAVQTLTWPEAVLLAVFTAINIVTYAPPLMSALPGLKFIPALTVSLSSTASTYIAPGGAAVGMGVSFAMLRAWRFRAADITLAVTLTESGASCSSSGRRPSHSGC